MINQRSIRRRLSTPEWGAKGTHAGLWLDKYIAGQDRNEPDNRNNLVKDVATLPEPPEYKHYFERWQEMLKEYHAQTRRIQARGRVVIGLSGDSVLETSICLHHTYGVPYIPGSALKGLAASYAHHRLGEEWRKGGTLHTIVFGNTDDAGYIIFFDALYLPGSGHGGKALAPDVIAVHHQKYYQGASPIPSESDNPNPVPFLSATGRYLLALAAPDFQEPTRWVDITFQILAEALETFGIGAKTSSGYGRMKFLDPPVRPLDPEMRIVQGYKREIDALKDIAGPIHGYYQKWQLLTSQDARQLLARAIIEKVHQAGREKVTATKPWYQELQAYLNET